MEKSMILLLRLNELRRAHKQRKREMFILKDTAGSEATDDLYLPWIAEFEEALGNVEDPEAPYSKADYENAKAQGLDLDVWDQYVEYYGLGEEETYD